MNHIKYFILMCILILFIGCTKDNKLEWTAINVNSTGKQGDAHLISKGEKHFIIDTGQQYYVESTLIPFLLSKKIKVIDGILITHPHFDHYGGLYALIKSNFTIKKIYMNMPTRKQMKREWWGGKYHDLEVIREAAKKKHIALLPVNKGDTYRFDKTSYFEVLYAYDGIHTPVGVTDINDMSVIAMLHDGKNKFLFTGDLNRKLGQYLGEHAKNIKADILKFPHHGTEGFATNIFFKTVSPKVVIVPGPKYLWCSDRSKRARKLVEDNNYTAYINGFHGNITVTSDGEKYTISTEYSPEKICK